MEDNKNEMIYITMYADDTGLFSETECNKDNTVGFDVPRWILEDWYKQYEILNKDSTMMELGVSEEEATFDRWIKEVYTHDDFIGFYEFCLIKGFVPKLWDKNIDEIQDKVFYIDCDGNKQIVFEGTYDECRRWCKYNGWVYTDLEDCDYNLELEIK